MNNYESFAETTESSLTDKLKEMMGIMKNGYITKKLFDRIVSISKGDKSQEFKPEDDQDKITVLGEHFGINYYDVLGLSQKNLCKRILQSFGFKINNEVELQIKIGGETKIEIGAVYPYKTTVDQKKIEELIFEINNGSRIKLEDIVLLFEEIDLEKVENQTLVELGYLLNLGLGPDNIPEEFKDAFRNIMLHGNSEILISKQKIDTKLDIYDNKSLSYSLYKKMLKISQGSEEVFLTTEQIFQLARSFGIEILDKKNPDQKSICKQIFEKYSFKVDDATKFVFPYKSNPDQKKIEILITRLDNNKLMLNSDELIHILEDVNFDKVEDQTIVEFGYHIENLWKNHTNIPDEFRDAVRNFVYNGKLRLNFSLVHSRYNGIFGNLQ